MCLSSRPRPVPFAHAVDKVGDMTPEMPAASHKEKLPIVTCPGCNQPMRPGKPESISTAAGLADIVYQCGKCGTATTRTVKQMTAQDRPKRKR